MENLAPYRLTLPSARQAAPLLISSPHSGSHYPSAFLAASRLDAHQIRQSEDMFVADLLDGIDLMGASLLAATYPRAYLDLNRAANELEPALFEDALPDTVDRKSQRAAAGLGTVPRLVAENVPIYARKLKYADAAARIEQIYHPFHQTLRAQLDDMHAAHGFAVLLDAHSMPSQATQSAQLRQPGPAIDFVLGDRHGRACASILPDFVGAFLMQRGYRVEHNQPYAGGYITDHYGRPAMACHALQIEMNRAIYMDERGYTKTDGFDRLRTDLHELVGAIIAELPAMASHLRPTNDRTAAE